MNEIIDEWRAGVREAAANGRLLRLCGGGSKDFLGRTLVGDVFDTRKYAGIVSYEPTELVVTARAGTSMAELEATLGGENQMLAFEPPHFGPTATLGGCVASGLSGPRRQAVGSLRDFILGVSLIDGRGELMAFGGQVMKNVAGYDVSRLIAGSFGTLGLITEVSLKVLPRPVAEATLSFECGEAEAIRRLNEWGGRPLPISASAWHDDTLKLRLSGADAAVRAAMQTLGGERLPEGAAAAWWESIREQTHEWFQELGPDDAIWRLALPSTAAPVDLCGTQIIEWGGGQRWLRSIEPPEAVRGRATALGGHATLFRGGDRSTEVFQWPASALMTIHRRLKAAFDPAGIFNPGRLYDGL